MPTLPPLSVQIEKGINSWCVWCQCPVDRRSIRCRRCHSTWVATKMYPSSKRLKRECRDCGSEISHKSAKGKGRCKRCDIIHRGNPAAYDNYCHYNGSLATNEEVPAMTAMIRSSNTYGHKNPDSSHYDNQESIHTSSEASQVDEYRRQKRNDCLQPIQKVCNNDILISEETFAVANAWVCLGKCWSNFKIAQCKDDQESMAVYGRRIRYLSRLLKLQSESMDPAVFSFPCEK